MRLVALKDFTLGGETHAKGEVFEADQMRGEAWIVAKVARRASAGEEVVTQPIAPAPPEAAPKAEPPEAETLPASDDPKVRRVIEDDNED